MTPRTAASLFLGLILLAALGFSQDQIPALYVPKDTPKEQFDRENSSYLVHVEGSGALVVRFCDPGDAVSILPDDFQRLFREEKHPEDAERIKPDEKGLWNDGPVQFAFEDGSFSMSHPEMGKMEFLAITAKKAVMSQAIAMGTHRASFTFVENENQLRVHALNRWYKLPAKVSEETPNRCILLVGADNPTRFTISRGRSDAHWGIEFMGAKLDTYVHLDFFHEKLRDAEPSVPLEEAMKITHDLQALTPLQVLAMYAELVLRRMDGYPVVPEGVTTSTEVFAKILNDHPDLRVETFTGKPGGLLTAANNPWCLVIDERRALHREFGAYMFSKNFKPTSMNLDDLEKALKATKALVLNSDIVSTRGFNPKYLNRKNQPLTILRP